MLNTLKSHKKKSRPRLITLMTGLLSAAVLTACTVPASSTGHTSGVKNTDSQETHTAIGLNPGDSQEFNDFLMELFNAQITSNSIDFHYSLEHPKNYGLSMDEVTFGTVSLDDMDASLADTKQTLKALQSFDKSTLSQEQKLIYEMLEDTFEASIKSFDYNLYQTIFSPTIGIQAQLPVILSEYAFRSEQDIDDYITLLTDVDRYFEDLLEIEKEKSSAGLFMADFTADAIISQCEDFIADPKENLLIDIFQEKLADEMPGLTDAQVKDYTRRNEEAVLNDVIPAYEMVIDTLTQLKGTGKNDGGLANFDKGKDYYAMLAASATGSSWTVDEMIQRTDQHRISYGIFLDR